MDGAAEDEISAARNVAAFDDIRLVPRVLVDAASATMTTRLLGQTLAAPILCSPTGASRFYHPGGELAVARAAAAAGLMYGLSTMATTDLAEVAAASDGPKMFQLYMFRDRGLTREMIARCRQAGFDALCLTVDASVRGKRERELRSGMSLPLRLSARSVAAMAAHPQWLFGQARRGRPIMANLPLRAGDGIVAQTRFVGAQLDPSVTWDDVGEIVDLWGGPFALKGVMAPADAQRAAEAGVHAVILSNHGGRQLDGAAAPIEILPAVAQRVGGRIEIVVDGGIRRGSHILKALALGATACSIGRPYLYGLAAGGEAGVARALDILRDELTRAMQLSGCTSTRAVSPDLIRRCRELT